MTGRESVVQPKSHLNDELKILSSYVLAVIRQWWVIVVEVFLVLTDLFERIFGTWLLPSTRVKVVIGFVALSIAQYRAYREIVLQKRRLEQGAKEKREWQPKARIEPEPPQSYLILKSDREFLLDSISLKFANGAVAATIEVNRDHVRSAGFRFALPGDAIEKEFWGHSAGPRNGSAEGSIEAVVLRDDHAVTVSVPFVARQEVFTTNTGAIVWWIKLTG